MPRRIWIISRKGKVEQADIDDANLNGCPEIANGIPPILQGILSKTKLPCVYEEPEVFLSPEPVRDLAAEIDEIKARLGSLEKLKG